MTPQRFMEYVDLVRVARGYQARYRATVCPFARKLAQAAERKLDAATDELAAELLALVCPKCGGQMAGGSPHGPWPVQYECRACGHVVVPATGCGVGTTATEGGAA